MKINSTMLYNKFICFTILVLCLPVSIWSQQNTISSYTSYAEKIYLQLDSDVYTTDNTIWYKAIVTTALKNTPTVISGVLYVELISPDEKILVKKLVKLENGIGEGFFDLNSEYFRGTYLIRAYTQWNKNFESDFFFKKYIQVFNSSEKKETNPFVDVVLEKKQNNEQFIKVNVDPFLIDSLHKKSLSLYIDFGEKKDSLIVKKNQNDQFVLEYPVPEESKFVTLQFQSKNALSKPRTIVLDEDYFDFQFFPESGELVHGIQSKVGFKALDVKGKGKSIEGNIVNQKGEFITSFKSNKLGMGSFVLKNVDSTAEYFAQLISQSKEELSVNYPMPKISSLGNVLSITSSENKIHMTAASNYYKNDSVFIQIACRGLIYYELKGRFEAGRLKHSIPGNRLPEGIIAFTMLDWTKNPVAERLYFNERLENRLNIELTTGKKTYEQREKTKLKIKTTNEHREEMYANLSVLVLNKEQNGQTQGLRQNILSYFLLNSDLKGEVEAPGFYFTKNKNRHKNIDDLLLTQGWSKYHYSKSFNTIIYPNEISLSVSGSVEGALLNNNKKDIDLTLMTFGKPQSFQKQRTDSLGNFLFNLDDEYGQPIEIIIQSAKKSGKKKNYSIHLNKEVSPPILFNQVKSIENVDNVVYELVHKNYERKKVEDSFQFSEGDTQLDEVVLDVYDLTPLRIKVMEEYGKPDEVIKGKSILEKEENWSYGLYSVLMFNYPDKVNIFEWRDELYAGLYNTEPTLVVIDGIPVRFEMYPFIPSIPTSEVKSFEIIEYAKNFQNLWCNVFPRCNRLRAPTRGNVIAIYTHAGKGLSGTSKTVGLTRNFVQVFSPTREFYVPQYKNLDADDWRKPDLRALIHWESKVLVDGSGMASSTFYNADNVGEMLVVVEAISDTGEIGYQELIYKVEKFDDGD